MPKPPHKVIPKRRKGNKEMTIVAGFVCTDGIVMCADSQESGDGYKFPVEKLINEHAQHISFAMAGAGVGPLIDMAVERVGRVLRERKYQDYDSVADRITDELVALYDREFRLYPIPEEDKLIDLLLGVKIRESKFPILYKTSAATLAQVKECAVLGSGRAVQYQIYKLFRPPQAVRRVIPVAINLLNVASIVLDSVGGSGRIVTLHEGENVGMGEVWGRQIQATKEASERLEYEAANLLLDLLDVSISEDEFRKQLFALSSAAIELRVEHIMNHKQEMAALKALMEGLKGTFRPSEPRTSGDQQ